MDKSPKLMGFRNLDPSRRLGRLGIAFGLSFFVTSMNGCDGISWNEAKLASKVKERGEIRVLTLKHPLVDEPRQAGPRKGLERELLTHFADTYGLKIRFLQRNTLEALMTSLRQGEGDVAAGRLWTQENRRTAFLQGPVFEESHLSLFCRRKLKVRHISDLSHLRVALLTKDNVDSIDTRLKWLVPEIKLRLENQDRLRPLFQNLHEGTLDCAFAENIDGSLHARLSSKVEKIDQPMTSQRGLSWLINNDRADLASLMHAWFQRASRDDEIMRIQDHHQANLSELDRNDAQRFLINVRSRFPGFKTAFLKSAKEHHLDWKLVASIAYQESQWNPEARSFTGVLGIMQLTNETARTVGIADRTDPEQSIWGGSYYLRFLLKRMPRHL
ncbi:MAG TPA: transglycosylase SLT domain-containing protein, partial [Pseudobdellovibrionaceae bacterium]|nr:transglycosylase SLT domain-containing protein [Pseudobdellovibrionaceae bacterium]